tara:strand:+ start:159 stop:443 length:285 start_codon:yes stop_codon:yes gene_type:complete
MDFKKKYLKYKKKYINLKNLQLGGYDRVALASKGKVKDLLISMVSSANSTFSPNNSSMFSYSQWANKYFYNSNEEYMNLNINMMNRLIREASPL